LLVLCFGAINSTIDHKLCEGYIRIYLRVTNNNNEILIFRETRVSIMKQNAIAWSRSSIEEKQRELTFGCPGRAFVSRESQCYKVSRYVP
jgi:hypothetical protein